MFSNAPIIEESGHPRYGQDERYILANENSKNMKIKNTSI
jgi:hypothetical protein